MLTPASLDPTITRCPTCATPTHATESDDTGACAACVAARPILPWGGPAPAGVTVAWGARAIYRLDTRPAPRKETPRKAPAPGARPRRPAAPRTITTAEIDLLWDRQGGIGDSAARAPLMAWINKVGLPALRLACAAAYLTPDSEARLTISRDGYTITASPRSSYGYLYVTAYPEASPLGRAAAMTIRETP
jgi:hypothetical protein